MDANFASFFGGNTGASRTSGFDSGADDPNEIEARRRQAENRRQAYDLARGGVARAGQGSPDEAALREQLSGIASGQGGAGGERARSAEIARATDQAAAAAGARAMAAAGGNLGANQGQASRAFDVQNLTAQQQDVQRARQTFDATAGANREGQQLDATRQLAQIESRRSAERQAAEDRLRQMLMEEDISADSIVPEGRGASRSSSLNTRFFPGL